MLRISSSSVGISTARATVIAASATTALPGDEPDEPVHPATLGLVVTAQRTHVVAGVPEVLGQRLVQRTRGVRLDHEAAVRRTYPVVVALDHPDLGAGELVDHGRTAVAASGEVDPHTPHRDVGLDPRLPPSVVVAHDRSPV